MKKVRTGLVALWESGIREYLESETGTPDGIKMQAYLDNGTASICRTAEQFFDVADPGPVADREDAAEAVRIFREKGIELLLVVSMFWSGDKALVKILQAFPETPVIYWCYVPASTVPSHMTMPDVYSRSGAVGAIQNSAMLARLGREFAFVFGTPETPELVRDLENYAKAYEVLFALRGARLGQIGGRYEEMTGTYVDEFLLLKRFGIDHVPITPGMVKEAGDTITEEELDAAVRQFREKYPVCGVTDQGLRSAVKVSMAAAKAAVDRGVDILAVEDFNEEIRKLFGTRPQLWVDGLRERGITISMEADAVASLGMWIIRHLGETTPWYTEMFTCDIDRNAVLMGHASMLDPELARPETFRLIPDAELGGIDETDGAWLHFRGKLGPVTVTSLFAVNGEYRAVMFHGESVENDLMDVHPNILVKLGIPVGELFRRLMKRGMTQHFSVTYDDVADRFRKFCEIAKIDLYEADL